MHQCSMRAAQNIKKASQTSFCLTLPLATCAFRIGAHRSLVQASCTGCVCTATGAAHAGSSICEGRDSKGLCTLPTFPQLTQYLQASYPSLLQHNAHKHHQQPQKTCTSTHTHTPLGHRNHLPFSAAARKHTHLGPWLALLLLQQRLHLIIPCFAPPGALELHQLQVQFCSPTGAHTHTNPVFDVD